VEALHSLALGTIQPYCLAEFACNFHYLLKTPCVAEDGILAIEEAWMAEATDFSDAT
jgi:hypothetical protein